ncbi:acetoacetate decarboxylase family protein [Spirillospora sp. NPDC048911]|uniref:acetoacetate decarboxylase family protein n=1 Tax=Spirillospora sp. NPDC048911 TaxID=3364527 RepID=UPI00371B20B8
MNDPHQSGYPPPPWRSRGRMWTGFFRAEPAPALPADLTPVRPALTALMLIRYLEGTLRYDEFAVGTMARRGRHLGLFVHLIWVDDRASQLGGRRIWGLPKQLATFRWEDGMVEVTDDDGPVATVQVGRHRSRLPALPLFTAGLGEVDGQRVLSPGRLRGRPGLTRMRLASWSRRLPVRLPEGQARRAIALDPFRMTVKPAVRLGLVAARRGEE